MTALPLQVTAWEFGGDIRSGLYASERLDRQGERQRADDWRARIRLSADRDLAGDWRFRIRAAGRYSSDDNTGDAYFRAWAPTRSGIATGDTTIDTLQWQWQPEHGEWGVLIGRFQAQAGIPVVPGKGLDRKDSSNVGVSWTDGIELSHPLPGRWQGRSRLFYNHQRGAGGVYRFPLDHQDSGSRLALSSAFESTAGPGPLILRRVTITWMPDSLAPDGPQSPRREDYRSLTGSLATSWPVAPSGTRLVVAGELGFTDARVPTGLLDAGDEGTLGGRAWQASANLFDLAPGHLLGLVYGEAEGSWLHSVDYRNNDALAEIRYQYRFTPALSFEGRYRWRRELKVPDDSPRRRVDQDIYLRLSARF
ncbi:hypothetical protein VCB98_01665 [Gammaproteobacteria bacterium AB-CW1]|uniref:Porin n=1 Tax=Natronospira elongata TaxID=3110268 RepID=A0AAP6JDJ5_9GAMM|nr:hypothetical protein [Gammaproteobacteria bacterium AB-CW1]